MDTEAHFRKAYDTYKARWPKTILLRVVYVGLSRSSKRPRLEELYTKADFRRVHGEGEMRPRPAHGGDIMTDIEVIQDMEKNKGIRAGPQSGKRHSERIIRPRSTDAYPEILLNMSMAG